MKNLRNFVVAVTAMSVLFSCGDLKTTENEMFTASKAGIVTEKLFNDSDEFLKVIRISNNEAMPETKSSLMGDSKTTEDKTLLFVKLEKQDKNEANAIRRNGVIYWFWEKTSLDQYNENEVSLKTFSPLSVKTAVEISNVSMALIQQYIRNDKTLTKENINFATSRKKEISEVPYSTRQFDGHLIRSGPR